MLAPFNGQKALYHVKYWEPMLEGKIPPPVLVTLDPINRCNLRCNWCNAAAQLARSKARYDDETIDKLPEFLKEWGVKAVCIAGGGEPLLHKRFSDLANGLCDRKIQVGIVTNGTLIHKHLDALGRCKWVGVSVDAGTSETYTRFKGVNAFGDVLGNIESLRDCYPDLEITYKYLIHPSNINEIDEACDHAEELKCSYFHARPVGITWEEVKEGKTKSAFNPFHVAKAVNTLERCKKTSGKLQVIATCDKYAYADWGLSHPFEKCYAVNMTCVIQPDRSVSLCCDRRGDPRLNLINKWSSLADIRATWGTGKHLEIWQQIELKDCPRCTYSPHNQIFETFAADLSDRVCKYFI